MFTLLGLSAYQKDLVSDDYNFHFNMKSYLLADDERLMLRFDNTGMQTGTNMIWDYAGDASHRLVIDAELASVVRSSNGPPFWQATLHWP